MDGLAFFFVLVVVAPLTLIVVGAVGSRLVEARHFADLEVREAQFADIVVSDLPTPVLAEGRGVLVGGSVVMGISFGKMFVLSIINLVGGDAPQIDKVMQRARREALLRLKAEARALGAREVVNLRIETSTISANSGRSNQGSGEIFCHGTAIVPA